MKNNVVKILATLGLIVALALVLKGVFGVGEIGLKKIKTNTNKQIKNSKEKFSFVSFTCEGKVVSKHSILGEDSSINETKSFIDEYEMLLVDNVPAALTLKKSNNWSNRPLKQSVASQQTLESSQSSISIYHQNYKLSDEFTTTLYKAMISLLSGSFSGNVDGYYKDVKYLYVLTGRCFGLEKYIESLNEK